ncbi:hypothetical protein MASR1M97_11350 [Candidatus Desulfobacillus denitrificans]
MQGRAAVVLKLEGDLRMGQRDAPHGLLAVGELGVLAPEELAPRRRVEVEVVDLDHRAAAERGGRDVLFGPDAPGVRCFAQAADQSQSRHGGDRGQRLATEAERGDAFEILQRGDLAGGVTGERQRQLVLRNAAAVVDDADLPHAALEQLHRDIARAGVEAVLQQLLHHRGRPLDHLAGGDLADEEVGKRLDGGHGSGMNYTLRAF